MQFVSSGCWKQLPTLLWKTRKGEVKTKESPLKQLGGLSSRGTTNGAMKMSNMSKPTIRLIGEDGNAFAILARARKALREAGRENEFDQFMAEATSGDYDHLLRVTMEWFEVE
jgi:hypothetical protein